jgi:hypothetical protein
MDASSCLFFSLYILNSLMLSKLILQYLAEKLAQRHGNLKRMIFVAASASTSNIPVRGLSTKICIHSDSQISNYSNTAEYRGKSTHHLPSGDLAGASSHAERLERRNPPPRGMLPEQAGVANRFNPCP